MPSTISFKGLQMRASQAEQESVGEDAQMASQGRSDSLLNAEFRSCPSRYCSLLWGVNRTLLQRLWAFALAFLREAFASLDVSCTAAATLPPN